MKLNFQNLFGGIILLLLGFLKIGDTTLQRDGGYAFKMEWWVPYTMIAGGVLFLVGELIACRKRK